MNVYVEVYYLFLVSTGSFSIKEGFLSPIRQYDNKQILPQKIANIVNIYRKLGLRVCICFWFKNLHIYCIFRNYCLHLILQYQENLYKDTCIRNWKASFYYCTCYSPSRIIGINKNLTIKYFWIYSNREIFKMKRLFVQNNLKLVWSFKL